MAAQRDEERTLEEILEQRRLEGSCLQLEVVRTVPERVVHERKSQCKGVKGLKEKKNVSGWSVEEVKETPNVAVEEDTEEMRNWRGLSNFAILLDLRVTKVVQLLSDTEGEGESKGTMRGTLSTLCVTFLKLAFLRINGTCFVL